VVEQKTAGASLALHWREYLIEGWALGAFMVSAGVATTLIEYPGFWLHQAITDPDLRRTLIGVAMGLTAVALIYSPWGQRSGAHMNPAVTLTFLRLGKIARWDALFFIVAQCLGGILGVLCCW
jgi:aquaporin Z